MKYDGLSDSIFGLRNLINKGLILWYVYSYCDIIFIFAVCWFSVCLFIWENFSASDWSKAGDITRCRQTSYDIARILLMVPFEPWENFTPFFGAAAFCTTEIDNFRASLTLTSSTTLSAYWSKRWSLRWTSLKRQIMEVTEVDKLEDTNNRRLSWAMPHTEYYIWRKTTFDGR